MLGVAAATAAGAVTSTNLPAPTEAATPVAPATPPAPNPAPDPADLNLFVTLSSALTGIAAGKLAPTVDPIQIKNDYFATARADPAFPALLQIIRSDPTNPAAAADKVMNDPKLKYLGRSIVLAWYHHIDASGPQRVGQGDAGIIFGLDRADRDAVGIAGTNPAVLIG
jgi:hypothetical protein